MAEGRVVVAELQQVLVERIHLLVLLALTEVGLTALKHGPFGCRGQQAPGFGLRNEDFELGTLP
jgi:hypothetical protein